MMQRTVMQGEPGLDQVAGDPAGQRRERSLSASRQP
jgi:hypothetical protein